MMRFSKKALVVFAALMCCFFLAATQYTFAKPPPPPNDLCEQAIGPLSVPSRTPGTTENATFDDVAYCGTDNTAPGVWYTVVGTGTRITASTCSSLFGCDTKISVFCRSCDEPICINGNDDNCPDGASPFLSTVSWCSQVGAEYLILVHGFESEVGDFELSLSEDGQACEPELQCIAVGACCLSGASCQDSYTQVECEEAGGLYQGDDTLCDGGFVYTKDDRDNKFEDISADGTESAASNCDDCGEVVPIGFPFNFYGETHTDIGVSSNGYLTFGDDLGSVLNDPIPNTYSPNYLIAPYWDDWNPSAGGTVHYQTSGDTPNRRFIAQWNKVEHYDGGGKKSTFQAILFEGTNCIEFQYRPRLNKVSPTIGIENQDGTKGINVTSVKKKGFSFCPEVLDPIECDIKVSLDIEPLSCPNPLNIKSREVIPAAILGSDSFDVSEVDVSTVQLEGVEPLLWSLEDVASPFEPMVGKVDCREDCNDLGGPDGSMDLTLKFDTREVIKALGKVKGGECLTLQLTGNLLDGTAVVGEDVVVILKKGKKKKKKKGKN
jgi:hypothetical protein